jgi:hypothetical protein
MARTVNIAANAPKRLTRPRSGKLVAYQVSPIQDHQMGMKSAAKVTVPAAVGSAWSMAATAPTATTKQRSKKSSSHEAWRSAAPVTVSPLADVPAAVVVTRTPEFERVPRASCVFGMLGDESEEGVETALLRSWEG